jgi:hypothetical protein
LFWHLLAGPLQGEHICNRVSQIGHRWGQGAKAWSLVAAQQQRGQPEKPLGIGFVGGIPHGDQRWIDQPQALLQHIAAGRGFGATDEPPGKPCVIKAVEKFWRHQQGFVADEALPAGGIPMGVAAKVGLAENRDNVIKSR